MTMPTWAVPQMTLPCSPVALHQTFHFRHSHRHHHNNPHKLPPSRHHHHQYHHHHRFFRLSASPLSSPPPTPSSDRPDLFYLASDQRPGFTIIEEFYAGINRRDLDAVRDLIAEDCVYEDLIFPQPFVGRQAILEFFSKFTGAIGSELQFAIDEISKNDPLCIGVTWHLEWKGKPFPFSKGCSFYRLTTSNGKQQIVYGRDSVEPAIKPGNAALVAIEAVAALFKRFPGLVDRL